MASGEEKVKVASGSLPSTGGAEVMVTSAGVVSTIQSQVAGGPVLPAASVAVTAKAWAPSARSMAVNGLVHGAGVPASRVHVKPLAPGAVKVIEASGSMVGSIGASVMVTVGATVSTVQPSEPVEVLPAGSVAVTEKLWGPSVRPVAVDGEVQAVGVPASRVQVKVAVASGEENSMVASGSLVGSVGAARIVTPGGVVSSVQVAVAGTGSVAPETVAVTSTVCAPSARPVGVNGEVHDTGAPPSTVQVKVALSPGGSVPKLTDADGSLVRPDGAAVMTVSNTVSDCVADGVKIPLVA